MVILKNCYTQSWVTASSDTITGYAYVGYIKGTSNKESIENCFTANLGYNGVLVDNGITSISINEIWNAISLIWDKNIWEFSGGLHPYLLG